MKRKLREILHGISQTAQVTLLRLPGVKGCLRAENERTLKNNWRQIRLQILLFGFGCAEKHYVHITTERKKVPTLHLNSEKIVKK